MKRAHYFYTTAITTLLLTQPLHGANFIFDFGGVLINTSKIASFENLGLITLIKYIVYLKKNPFTVKDEIKTKFFQTLHQIADIHNITPENNNTLCYDEEGNELPYLMQSWLAGTMTNDHILSLTNNTLQENSNWFEHASEQQLITNMCRMVFTPDTFIQTQQLYPEGIQFVKSCKRKGHKVFIISNWDAESFSLLYQRYQKFFALFDGIVISGEHQAVKPSPTLYTLLLERYNLNPQECWFINDQKHNVVAANELNINSIVCPFKGSSKKPNFREIIRIIKNHYSKSETRRENRKNMGISVNNTNTASNAIIDGENISPTDSTKYNCRPAKA
jgi:HAD superfamily hydrolase (TIGR01549 family)